MIAKIQCQKIKKFLSCYHRLLRPSIASGGEEGEMGSVGSRLARKTCFALIVLGIYAGSQRLTSSGLHHISGMVSGAAGVMLTLGGAATQPTMMETGGRNGFTGLADG